MQLLEQIGVHDEDIIVSLGDIVDRGDKSLELYHYFKNRKTAIVLMGNHERKHRNGVLSYSQEIVKLQFGKEYSDFIDWADTLPYYYETEEAIVVHAFFEHDRPLAEQKEGVLAGTTSGSRYLEGKYGEGSYWSDHYTGLKPIIYGHHVVGERPKIKNKTYGIDTGACHGGMLTAIELPGFVIHQVPVARDLWKEESQKWQIPVLEAKNWEEMEFEQIHKQIEKLSYKEDPALQAFLNDLRNWVTSVEDFMEPVFAGLKTRSKVLEQQYPASFNQEVSKLEYAPFLFKAKSNNLGLADLKKYLRSPAKLTLLAHKLEIDNIPCRTSKAE